MAVNLAGRRNDLWIRYRKLRILSLILAIPVLCFIVAAIIIERSNPLAAVVLFLVAMFFLACAGILVRTSWLVKAKLEQAYGE
ncbi:MAG: hypothetical protein OEZ29_01370 [Candidatus Bathyarchaeota archaeon]|nr:hypothetical protein [Candidatus Bathyarchaeota archaeon]MDH5779227.1 hypothetical protein [Candidatus Bathyarchaeota archaeon]